ncbi:methyltransferase [Candidatus Woesearchaeota archaeon]|nr:methyltransferase [Candidatus Woesearchaeota archaeon]
MTAVILTKSEIDKILAFSGEFEISPDLGKSSHKVKVEGGSLIIDHHKIPLSIFKGAKDDTCYIIHKNKLEAVAFFSDETKLYYKLVPTGSWPTIKISSTPMHRHIHLSPKQDTNLKIRAISPVDGRVLDTCCGLGYTAVVAAKTAEQVVTFEKDKNVIHIAEFNPYSESLFNNPKIMIMEKDVFPGIKKFPGCFFDCIIHDPPTVAYAPELYSSEFHSELFRVLKPYGRLFHYCPTPRKTKGKLYYPKLIRRLKDAGFNNVFFSRESSGIVARK